MNEDKTLSYPWGKTEAERMIAYGTQDAYFSPAAPAFFAALFGARQLDWFQSSAAGLEHPMMQATGRKADQFTRSPAQSDAIAEWVICAGFDAFQNGPARRAAQAARHWTRIPFREISSTHWLIIGFGGIGQATGQRLRALGARVTGVRRTAGSDPAADALVTPDAVPDLLPQVDAVVLCLPHTEETEAMADADFFAAMAPGALFVNVGRGALVDEDALLAGLAAGRPGHAALDVFRTEPLPQDSPFWTHPHVTLTAHIAALTEQAKRRTDALFLDNLARFLSGQALLHAVSKAAFADEAAAV